MGQRRRRGVRVAAYLALLTFAPLCGMAFFTAVDVVEHGRTSREAAAVAAGATQLARLYDLRVRFADEGHSVVALATLRTFGVPAALARAGTGVDLTGLLARRRDEVDELAREFGLEELIASLGPLRSGETGDVSEISQRYTAIEDELTSLLAARYLGLRSQVRTIPGAELVDLLTVLDAAGTARQASTEQLRALYLNRVNPSSTRSGREFERYGVDELLEQRAVHAAALRRIEDLAPRDAAVRDALDRLAASGDRVVFERAVDGLVGRRLDGRDDGIEESSVAAVFALDVTSRTFEAATGLAETEVALVDAAGSDVRDLAETIASESRRAYERSVLIAAVAAIASLAFVVAMTSTLGRPLRRLAAQARDLGNGRPSRLGAPSGPREVREASEALDEASDQLRLAEQQALALACGDLDDELLQRPAAGPIGASLQRAVHTLAASMSDREEFRRRLAHQSTHDGLTQLPNRNASLVQLQQGLARTVRTGGALAVITVDLVDFKHVNDRHGHRVGDALLRAVAQRLATTVREGDHVGRLDSDEFVVIAEAVAGPAEAYGLAARLLAAVEQPVAVGGIALTVGATAGVAMGPLRDLTADELLRDADLANDVAARTGPGRVEFCSDELRAELRQRVDLEEALHHAMTADELLLHYQPIATASTGVIESFEALVRWDRPGHGFVPPGEFVPFAERSDLVVALDRWVVRAAVRQLASWTPHPWLGRCQVAVNVSGRSLLAPRFVSTVLEPLAAAGVSARRLVVEVTESALLDDVPTAAANLGQLRAAGVQVSIDDFGTGYTSLGHLRALPFDVLKIDRSFVADDAAQSLVKLIVDAGHLLGARIVAEGVETPAQVERMRAMGVDKLQGWYFGRATAPAELLRWASSTAPA